VDHADLTLLARMRVSIRAVNRAIEQGSASAELTVQQQAFLLALSARGGKKVPLAEIREELGMDQATASDLLARLVRRVYVVRAPGADRRSADLSITTKGRGALARSVKEIRRAMRAADRAGELDTLATNMDAYLRYYGIRRRASRGR
jgi:DNA-binding MarR family transcriptional regulator